MCVRGECGGWRGQRKTRRNETERKRERWVGRGVDTWKYWLHINWCESCLHPVTVHLSPGLPLIWPFCWHVGDVERSQGPSFKMHQRDFGSSSNDTPDRKSRPVPPDKSLQIGRKQEKEEQVSLSPNPWPYSTCLSHSRPMYCCLTFTETSVM